MSVALIVERIGNGRGTSISIEEWKQLVAAHPDLRLRTEPYIVDNPQISASIQLPVGEADAEIRCGEKWQPLLRFRKGKLVTEFHEEFKDSRNIRRMKIADVAKQLGAVVATDAGDERLDW